MVLKALFYDNEKLFVRAILEGLIFRHEQNRCSRTARLEML